MPTRKPDPENPFGRSRFKPPDLAAQKAALDIQKELDAVVGPYQQPKGRGFERWGRFAGRALLGVCLAIAAATAIIYTLDSHVRQAQTAPAPKKPVTVNILPAR